jgi:hypothetical protein
LNELISFVELWFGFFPPLEIQTLREWGRWGERRDDGKKKKKKKSVRILSIKLTAFRRFQFQNLIFFEAGNKFLKKIILII